MLADSQSSTKDIALDSTQHSRSRSLGIATMHNRSQSLMHTTSLSAKEQNRSSSAGSAAVREEHSHINTSGNNVSRLRSRCRDANVSRQQLIMLGMYHLTPQQEAVYDSFVEMLSTFDSFDMVRDGTAQVILSLIRSFFNTQKRITEDALLDAQRDDLLQVYGGTERVAVRKDSGVNEERERDGTKHLVTLNKNYTVGPENHRQV